MRKYNCVFGCLFFSVATSAQNYGIGVASPQSRLHVGGRLRADSFAVSTAPLAQLHTTGTVLHQAMATNPAGTLIYADSSGVLGAQPAQAFSGSNFTGQTIPDNSCTGISSTITINGAAPWVAAKDIVVTLTIYHSYNADIQAVLIPPNGQALTLINTNGGNGQNFVNCTLIDNATKVLPVSAASGITGSYKPRGLPGICFNTLASKFEEMGINFSSMLNPNGVWTLQVFDRNAGFTGSLASWSITNAGNNQAIKNFYVPRWEFGKLSGEYSANLYDNGRVGISTSSPAQQLDVDGTALNKNMSCVLYTTNWTNAAADAGYGQGTFFTPATIVTSGIQGHTRLKTQGGFFNTTPGGLYTTGIFTAPATGFYTISFTVKDIPPGRLIISASFNGSYPEELLDEYISGNCASCDDRNYSTTVFMHEGDMHRILRQVSSVNFGAMIITYRLEG